MVKQAAAALEGQTDGVILLALPADPHAQVDPPTRQHVHGGQLLGQHSRPSQRGQQHRRPQPDPRGRRGYRGQQDKWFQPLAVGAGGLFATLGPSDSGIGVGAEILAEHDVVGDHDTIDSDGIHGTGRNQSWRF